MSGTLRVILEVGKKRRVVASAMDWPGLDRWGTSEDDAIEKLLSYVPRYAGVAEGAGLARAFERARDVEVVERVPGSSSTDFWGIAHVPSQIERDVLSPADLERRLDLLRACWAYSDDTAGRVYPVLRPGPRSAGRSRDQIIRHVYVNEPEQFSRKVEVRTEGDLVLAPGRPRGASGSVPRCDPRLQRRRQAGPNLADPIPRAPHRPSRHGSRVGDGRPGSHHAGNAHPDDSTPPPRPYFCFVRFAFCCLGVGGLAAASVTWRNTLAIPGRSNAFCSAAISRSRRRARAASLAGRSSSVMPPGRPQACASAGAF